MARDLLPDLSATFQNKITEQTPTRRKCPLHAEKLGGAASVGNDLESPLLETLVDVPGAAGVIAKSQRKHDREPEDAGDDNELGAFGAVIRVHEEQHDEQGFTGGDYQGHDDVQASVVMIEVHGGRVDGGAREHHEHDENQKIEFWRNNVLGHACLSRVSLLMPVNQIQQREKINPDNIDEVPIETDVLDGRVVLRRKTARDGLFDQPNKQARAGHHVQSVQARHAKV